MTRCAGAECSRINTVQFINVWVTFLVFVINFGGKQNEYLETDV